jgi:hypothetical protein
MPEGGWVVLREFDYMPDDVFESRRVEAGDRVTDISPERAAVFMSLSPPLLAVPEE